MSIEPLTPICSLAISKILVLRQDKFSPFMNFVNLSTFCSTVYLGCKINLHSKSKWVLKITSKIQFTEIRRMILKPERR